VIEDLVKEQQALPVQPLHYAGNLQGRNPRETGAKGGLVVEVRPHTPAEPAFVRFAPVRWERLAIDALPDTHSLDLVVENLVQRVESLDRAPDETLALRTRGLSQPIDTEALRASPTVVAAALDLIDAVRTDPARLDTLAPEELATPVAHGEQRQRYLEDLLADLSQELIERSFAGDEA